MNVKNYINRIVILINRTGLHNRKMLKGDKMNKAKEYLLSIGRLDAAINVKLEEIDRLRQSAISTSTELSPDKVQSSMFDDKFGMCIAMAADLSTEVDRDIDRLYDLKRQAVSMMAELKSELEMKILCDRYINYKNMSQIAKMYDKSVRTVQRFHASGLENFTNVMKNHKML